MTNRSDPGAARLVGLDWGTSRCRAYLLDDAGRVLARAESGDGILHVADAAFAAAAAAMIAHLGPSARGLPVLLSGMIGSRQGWLEVPYLPCPADVDALARRLRPLDVDGLGRLHFVPGLSHQDAAGRPDVMRGEETQVLGALTALDRRDGLFLLPGTHSKWVAVRDRRVERFATYMTGEVFAALREHTILGRLMHDHAAGAGGGGFARGIAASGDATAPGDLLRLLFSVRSLGLFDRLPPGELADYLSGLLIGAELRAATRAETAGGPVCIVAGAELAARYAAAAAHLGIETKPAPADCVVQGYAAIARAAQL